MKLEGMIDDEVLAGIIQALLEKEPITEGEQWFDRCGYCGGYARDWKAKDYTIHHDDACPWWRLKRFVDGLKGE